MPAGLAILISLVMAAGAAETPKRGGILTYLIPADAPPSFDGHREATFTTIHAVAPFYSVLLRANPENPADTTNFVCDVCGEMPEPRDAGRTYAFTAGCSNSTWLPPGFRMLTPCAAATASRLAIRQSCGLARMWSSVLPARGMPCPLFVG